MRGSRSQKLEARVQKAELRQGLTLNDERWTTGRER